MTQDEALNILKLGQNVFITGAAGTGKTHLLNSFIEYLQKNKVEVGITASTGIAATHMNGITIHSWSGIGIENEVTKKSLARIKRINGLEERIKNTKVLIIDEVSMLQSHRLDMVNFVCQRIRKNTAPFGGIQVVMSGDFFQLPPVHGDDEPEAKFVVHSGAWKSLRVKVCYLEQQYRQDDPQFLKVLNEIRSSNVSQKSIDVLRGRLNKSIDTDLKMTQLFTTNLNVNAINSYELNQLDSEERQFLMSSQGVEDLIKKLKKGCMAPEDLRLKVGATVMFVRNNFDRGYVNGTLGKVIGFDEEVDYPIVQTINGDEIIAFPEQWTVGDEEQALAEISQVPLRLAWAITVHKSQGMSLDAAIIDLSKAFVEGMGYVALSRLRRLDGIKLLGLNDMALKVNPESLLLDQKLKQLSETASAELKKIDKAKVTALQRERLEELKKEE